MEYKVFYFGNPYVEEDSLAIKIVKTIAEEFNDVDFIYVQTTYQLAELDLKNAILIDVADGIEKVCILQKKDIQYEQRTSAHDVDLGMFLEISDDDVTIIAIPIGYSVEKGIEEVKEELKKLIPNSL